MKDLDLLLPRVLEKAAACPEPTALRHLRDAAIEFCRRTRIWRDSDSFELSTDDCEAVAVEPGQVLFEISHATFSSDTCEERDLVPVTMDWLDQERPGWRSECGPPEFVTQTAPDTVRVVPKPETTDPAGTLTLQMILLPSTDADELPDVLIDAYSREIANGAIGAVLLLPAEFGNAQLGAYHTAEFDKALGRFSDRIPRGQQRAKRRVRPSVNF